MTPKKKAQFFCENCGAEVGENARFCPTCGRFFASVRCPQCGYTGSTSAFKKGCPKCHYAMPPSESIKSAPPSVKTKKSIFSSFFRNKKNTTSDNKNIFSAEEGVPAWMYIASMITILFIIALIFMQGNF